MWASIERIVYAIFSYIAGYFSGKAHQENIALKKALDGVRYRDESFRANRARSRAERLRRDRERGILRDGPTDDV